MNKQICDAKKITNLSDATTAPFLHFHLDAESISVLLQDNTTLDSFSIHVQAYMDKSTV